MQPIPILYVKDSMREISFELAKSLEDIGYTEKCESSYDKSGGRPIKNHIDGYPAPYIYELTEWVYKKLKILVNPEFNSHYHWDMCCFSYTITAQKDLFQKKFDHLPEGFTKYESAEEALEAGLLMVVQVVKEYYQ